MLITKLKAKYNPQFTVIKLKDKSRKICLKRLLISIVRAYFKRVLNCYKRWRTKLIK